MRWISQATSCVWGLFLAALLLGAVFDGAIDVIVYAACAFLAWLCAFVLACRRGPSRSRLALMAIPLSLLGPLAVVPVALVGRRKRRGAAQSAQRSKPALEPAQQPKPVPVAPQPPIEPVLKPAQQPEPAPLAPQPPIRPGARPQKRKAKHPYLVLAMIVLGSALAFPVVGLVILVYVVLAGVHVLTVTDARDIATVTAVAAGAAIVGTAAIWHKQSRDLSRTARSIGWSLLVVAAVPSVVCAVIFTRPGSPQNLARPSVTGRAEVGSVLTADPGRRSSFEGRLSFDYQWQAFGPSCTDIDGATHRTYVPGGRDLQRRIRVSVSASPSGGGINVFSSDWIKSAETAAVVP
jgi:hypothetical protein